MALEKTFDKQSSQVDAASVGAQRRRWVIIFCSGVCLMLGQYIAAREIGSTYFSTELTALAAVALSLLGNSLGYALAPKIKDKHLLAWGLAAFAFQLALPFLFRFFVGWTMGAPIGWILNGIVGIVTMLFIGFYASFLPRLSDDRESFCRLYALEMSGAIAGLSFLVFGLSWQFVLLFYWTCSAIVLALASPQKYVGVGAAIAAVLATGFYPLLDQRAASYFYAAQLQEKGVTVLETRYSPFQRVDVVSSPSGKSLFLDGLEYFSAGDLVAFNHMLSEIPGLLLPTRGKALVIGSGSFSSSAFLQKQGYDVTTVELDKAVADLGLKYFHEYSGLKPGDVRLVINDARTFLSHDDGTKYNIIALDVPAPYHVQTGLLYTPEFYAMVKRHLNPGGVACICLCSDDVFKDPVAASIGASAVKCFRDVVAVYNEGANLSFIYASDKLPFTGQQLAMALRFRARGSSQVWEDARVRAGLSDVPPLDKDHLAAVLYECRNSLAPR